MTTTKRHGNKKTITAILLASLLLVIGIGGTLAYLSATSTTLTNEFTFAKGDAITITLDETLWNAESAKNLTPGSTIQKNPTAHNTGSMPAYLAMKVTFQNGSGVKLEDGDYQRLIKMLEIDYDTTNFYIDGGKDASEKVYIYSTDNGSTATKLAATSGTATLFNTVKIKSDISDEDWTWLTDTLGGFKILVQAAALQADDNVVWDGASGEVKTELVSLFSAATSSSSQSSSSQSSSSEAGAD